jgi:thymidylate kinase
MRELVVIAGPIGAGKSTVADLLGRKLASGGRTTAVVDLDYVAFMQRGTSDVYEFWRRAASATAELIRGWFDGGTELVVAHGPFFESGGYETLYARQTVETQTQHVLLRVPTEVALGRVAGEPTRGMSRDPAFLRATHERFRELEPSLPAPSFVYDTTVLTAGQIADELARSLRQT